jgi:hypothetical protein
MKRLLLKRDPPVGIGDVFRQQRNVSVNRAGAGVAFFRQLAGRFVHERFEYWTDVLGEDKIDRVARLREIGVLDHVGPPWCITCDHASTAAAFATARLNLGYCALGVARIVELFSWSIGRSVFPAQLTLCVKPMASAEQIVFPHRNPQVDTVSVRLASAKVR